MTDYAEKLEAACTLAAMRGINEELHKHIATLQQLRELDRADYEQNYNKVRQERDELRRQLDALRAAFYSSVGDPPKPGPFGWEVEC
jgi:hypothetical protein